MKELRIRFNTTCNDNLHYWRIIYDGVEHLASSIKIEIPTFTTEDMIEGVGKKWHIGCFYNEIIWGENDTVTIK